MALDADPDLRPRPNQFLHGQFAPVGDQLITGDLPVTGQLPGALQGAFLRNGPNPQFPPIGPHHLFDGDGMVHAVELRDGVARYRNRWVESLGLLAERRTGQAQYGGLSEFHLPPPEVTAAGGMPKNTANTHVVRHGGKILALMEACPPTELTPELETVGEWRFHDALQGPMTAHPKTDPETGELVFFGYDPMPPYLRYHVADASGRLTTSVELDLGRGAMMHDFAVSKGRVTFFDMPAIFDLHAFLSGGPAVSWEPDAGARIGVLDRAAPGAGVRWFDVDPFYVFHFLNAYDDGDVLVVDGCRAARLPIAFGDEVLAEPVPPMLHRWRIDLAAGTVTDEPLTDEPGDFPRVNERFAGLPARYGYVARSIVEAGDDIEFDGFTRHDLVAGTSEVHSFGPDALAGEAVFAADPDRADEDAGWLLTFVQDRRTEASDLVVVEAASLEEVARVHLPRRVPFGFHGSWMADA